MYTSTFIRPHHERRMVLGSRFSVLVADRGVLALLAAYLLALPLLLRPVVHGADTVGYYAWLRSAVIDGDLDVGNEFAHFGEQFDAGNRAADLSRRTPTGYHHNQWAAGSALLWAPLYLAAHGAVLLARLLGAGLPADGYAWPYQLAAALGSSLAALAAALLTYAMARRYVAPFGAALATLTAWFATPLVFYSFSHPLMSHASDALATTLVIYSWWRTRDRPDFAAGLAVGLAVGLATWVRNQNALFVAAPLLLTCVDLAAAARQRERPHVAALLRYGLGTLAGFGLLFAPLLLFWRVVFGGWIVDPYAASQGAGRFDWRAPHLIEIFVSSNRGMFTWAPVTALALAGLWWLRRLDGRLTLALLAMFAGQLYIISCWFQWSGAAAFGPRLWSNMIALYALGLAALLARLPRAPRWALAAAGAAFICWNLLLIAQYALQTVPRGGPVDLAQMVRNQFLIIPQNLERLVGALLQRH